MNNEQSMFAEMLGMKAKGPERTPQVVRSVDRRMVGDDATVDELDVQRAVVEEMAMEKAELEEARASLESEKSGLESEKSRLEESMRALTEEKSALEGAKAELERQKAALEARVSELEADFTELKAELEAARAGNDELEEKLARMGRSLAAARRAAARSAGADSMEPKR